MEDEPTGRRAFLATSAIGLAGCAAAAMGAKDTTAAGAEPVSAAAVEHAERVAGVRYTEAERAMIASDHGTLMDLVRDRRRLAFPNALVPATTFDPRVALRTSSETKVSITVSASSTAPLPGNERDIAFAPVTQLAAWLKGRAITSERLTSIYLERLRTIGRKLECVVTPMPDLAMAQARAADAAIAAGNYKGPLHGVPWGAKDLLDTKGIRTTWGTRAHANRIPSADATVVKRLADAGAVLVAKLSTGELALDDVWFDGATKNPWNLLEGSGGSSAGPGAATAAGLVGFSIGSETLGSIVDPADRCGCTGLRPTFGRVPRTGAMALCWSLDKLGPLTRTVEDAILVLAAIAGADANDGIDAPLSFDAAAPIQGLKIGFDPKWFEKSKVRLDHDALDVLRKLGLDVVEIHLPDLPYGAMEAILYGEAGAAFEELALGRRLGELREQHKGAWPNFFREARFVSAVDFVQAERLRRHVMLVMADVFGKVDLLAGPCKGNSMLVITNMTGHPSLTVPAGFVEHAPQGQEGDGPRPKDAPPLGPPTPFPHGFNFWGRLFDEGTLARVGMAFERALGVWSRRPPIS